MWDFEWKKQKTFDFDAHQHRRSRVNTRKFCERILTRVESLRGDLRRFFMIWRWFYRWNGRISWRFINFICHFCWYQRFSCKIFILKFSLRLSDFSLESFSRSHRTVRSNNSRIIVVGVVRKTKHRADQKIKGLNSKDGVSKCPEDVDGKFGACQLDCKWNSHESLLKYVEI